MRRFNLDMRSSQIQISKIQTVPQAFQTVPLDLIRSSSSDQRAMGDTDMLI